MADFLILAVYDQVTLYQFSGKSGAPLSVEHAHFLTLLNARWLDMNIIMYPGWSSGTMLRNPGCKEMVDILTTLVKWWGRWFLLSAHRFPYDYDLLYYTTHTTFVCTILKVASRWLDCSAFSPLLLF